VTSVAERRLVIRSVAGRRFLPGFSQISSDLANESFRVGLPLPALAESAPPLGAGAFSGCIETQKSSQFFPAQAKPTDKDPACVVSANN